MLKQTKSFALPYANAYDYCVSIRNNNQDHERQIPENGRVDALNQGTTTFICSALVLVCVFSVLLDPLFFYLPVINESKQCIGLDKKLWTIALVLRSVTDFFHLMHICFRIRTRYKEGEPLSKKKRKKNLPKLVKKLGGVFGRTSYS